MRGETNRAKIERFMCELGRRVHGGGRVDLAGGGTAVLKGWREMTIDLDLKALPEPGGFFAAIRELKDQIDLNVELASPDDFIPELLGWQDRSPFIAGHGTIDFFHYDPYGPSSIQDRTRPHTRLFDVAAMLDRGLVARERLWTLFLAIEPRLLRYPSIEPAGFRAAVWAVCGPVECASQVNVMDHQPLPVISLAGLPGAELIAAGLREVAAGDVTVRACLVWIAQPRLQRLGLFPPGAPVVIHEPELTLYRLLVRQGVGDPYQEYNALLRRLVSFERSLDWRAAGLGAARLL